MQNYKEINGNDYVKNSRTTINETMQSIQSMNSGTAFPTNNLFEGMKCYRTDLKKTYTLTDVENNTWVEDAHATLSDEATHAASATKLDTARSLNLGGAVTADAATFDGTANATINVKTLDATKLNGTASVSTTGNAATATKVVATAAAGASANIAEATMASNDLARIRVSGATNAGELALETADDGSEPIVARQYTGIYTTPVRTAKILDESGNTSFPGTVVAPKFTGALNGNAATATKLQTACTLSLTGKATGSATFDGSANAAINVTSVDADTASKLSTARIINITGNATGSAAFDGTSDVSINVSVSQAAHADKATADANGNELANAQQYMHVYDLPNNTDFNNVKTTGIYTCTQDSYTNIPAASWGVLRVYWFNNNVKQEYVPDNRYEVYERYFKFKDGTWNAWSKVNAANADTATKLATPCAISLTGNASGSANFDGSNNISISTTVNESKHAAAADTATNANHATNADTATTANTATYASVLNNSGNQTAITGAAAGGLQLYQVYNNGYPTYFGNVLSIGGVGDGQILAGWSGADNGMERLYYRNRRDMCKTWSAWKTVAYYDDINALAPTKTGDGASGTWGINITGNANTASFISPFGVATTDAFRSVWFSDSNTNNKACYSPNIQYNPVSNVLKVGTVQGNITGNADTVDGYHASDIISKITAANTGGIVAASLTGNGYVKFANGLILQWGTGSGTVTFPIAFNTVYSAVATATGLSDKEDVNTIISSLTATSITISRVMLWDTQANGVGVNGTVTARWFAIGV